VQRRDLVKQLNELGWKLVREGGGHSVFGKGDKRLAVPRHN
jgi:predicted RNA binding protein YcfA (HicA-like mRNA interferase family)